MTPIRLAVVGAGQFGANHCRVIHESDAGGVWPPSWISSRARADAAAAQYGSPRRSTRRPGTRRQGGRGRRRRARPRPTRRSAAALLEAGIDVLVEKPIAPDVRGGHPADRDRRAPRPHPAGGAPGAVQPGRGGTGAPRDPAAVLRGPPPEPVQPAQPGRGRGAGPDDPRRGCGAGPDAAPNRRRSARPASRILSEKVDIANVRLQFPNGCVANLTASRVSTERVRKLRLFQPHQYLSLDYTRQDLAVFSVGGERQIGFEQAQVPKGGAPEAAVRCVPGFGGIAKSTEMYWAGRASKSRGRFGDS